MLLPRIIEHQENLAKKGLSIDWNQLQKRFGCRSCFARMNALIVEDALISHLPKIIPSKTSEVGALELKHNHLFLFWESLSGMILFCIVFSVWYGPILAIAGRVKSSQNLYRTGYDLEGGVAGAASAARTIQSNPQDRILRGCILRPTSTIFLLNPTSSDERIQLIHAFFSHNRLLSFHQKTPMDIQLNSRKHGNHTKEKETGFTDSSSSS